MYAAELDDYYEEGIAVDDWGNPYADTASARYEDEFDWDKSDEFDYAFPEEIDEVDIDETFEDAELEEALSELDHLAEAFSGVLHEDYAEASPETADEALYAILESVSPAEGFNFGKILRSVSKAAKQVMSDPVVGQVVTQALPVAGGAVGTFIGGPVGTALGTQLGQVAGSALAGSAAPARRGAAPAKRAAPTVPGPQQGSAAAAQLLQLTQDPNVLKSLLALSLGSHGRQSIQVSPGSPKVPVGGFMNLLSTLANRAAADADALAESSPDSTAYLQDADGEFTVDPAVPEQRAEALYRMLMNSANEVLLAEAEAGNFEYVDDDDALDYEDLYL